MLTAEPVGATPENSSTSNGATPATRNTRVMTEHTGHGGTATRNTRVMTEHTGHDGTARNTLVMTEQQQGTHWP